jgi:hypothetical protein
MDEEELKDREALRQKALWALARLAPGGSTAPTVGGSVGNVNAQLSRRS